MRESWLCPRGGFAGGPCGLMIWYWSVIVVYGYDSNRYYKVTYHFKVELGSMKKAIWMGQPITHLVSGLANRSRFSKAMAGQCPRLGAIRHVLSGVNHRVGFASENLSGFTPPSATSKRKWSTNGFREASAGWWFGSFFMFHHIWDNPSHWLSY